jgi:carbon-monoxide dehydrogenase large subunit
MTAGQTRGVGAPIKRNEDPRLLRGLGSFVDDVEPPGTLHAAILRGPYGHARIRSIDTARASTMPGVHAVYTAADLGALNQPSPLVVPHPSLTHGRTQRPLAIDEVNYIGEAVAMVVAESRYLAEDAVDAIEVDWEPLPATVDFTRAVDPGGALVHEDLPGNVAASFTQVVGDPDGAFAKAAHVFTERLLIERSCGSPIEARGVVAVYDARQGSLQVWDSTQAPLTIKNGLAAMLGLPEFKVEVIAPDVGGGFGTKILMFFSEEVLIPWAAIQLGRPVKWTEDRREHFIAASQERGQVHDAEIAVDADGRILGIRDRFLHDTGAYTPYGIVLPVITATQLPGPYKVPNYFSEFRVVYTNTPAVTPYRGAGRPHACFVMERLIDRVARELGIEPNEVRRRNFVQPDEMPWDVGLPFQDGAPTKYDSGDYPAGLGLAEQTIDLAGFRRAQAEAREQGRYLGIGFAAYVEGTGIGPYEGAHVRIEPSGKVFCATGLTSQGQGHYTSFAQIVASQLGCDPSDVTVVTGDTSKFTWGAGTYASRALVTAGNAIHTAAANVREKVLGLAASLLEVGPDDIVLEDGRARVKGAPDRELTLGALATAANPIRYAYDKAASEAALRLVKPRAGAVLAEGEEPGLESRGYFAPERATWASGQHAAIVEVDPGTGDVRILRYVAVHDCGVLINPLVVEGQIHGGVAQGIGGAFYEKLHYDETGQLLNASFMDFLIPTAMEIPDLEVAHIETPSPLNPLGVKGAGEAGTIPVAALMAEAIEDALAPLGVRISEMPLSPTRVWELMTAAPSPCPPPLSSAEGRGAGGGASGVTARYRIGIDTGGTFTDVVALDEQTGAVVTTKTPTTPADPSIGFMNGVRKIRDQVGFAADQIAGISHGTTIATNALLQEQFPGLGLIVTRGFRGILEIARQSVPQGYGNSYFWVKPERIVPLQYVQEVAERKDFQGRTLHPFDEADAERVAAWFRDRDITAVGVCFLHAYADGEHERRMRDVLRRVHPEAAVSISSEVLPEYREYERAVTTLIDAFVKPRVARYVGQIQTRVEDEVSPTVPFYVMKSNGGVISAREVAEQPITTILSGPAAGALGAAHLAQAAGFDRILTLDGGGTSADVSLVDAGVPSLTTEGRVGRYPVKVPMIDVVTIGTGGGSIAWRGPDGSLRVGPRSAGADPGPMCYGRGGGEPTITDAALVLGRIPPRLLGGEIGLDADLAAQGVEALASGLGLPPERVADGVLEIAAWSQANAVRQVSVKRGLDVRDYALVAIGGSGPLLAGKLVDLLSLKAAIVPPSPANVSALGLLTVDLKNDYVVTSVMFDDQIELERVEAAYQRLEHLAREALRREGFPEDRMQVQRSADMRYFGQASEVRVDVPDGPLMRASADVAVAGFHTAHEKTYGFSYRPQPSGAPPLPLVGEGAGGRGPRQRVEWVNLRVTGVGPMPRPPVGRVDTLAGDATRALSGRRPVFFDGAFVDTPLYGRAKLGAGDTFAGPAIVEEFGSTTVVVPSLTVRVDGAGNLILTRRR